MEPKPIDFRYLKQKAAWLRLSLFDMLVSAKQGHPGSTLSIVEILVSLYYGGIIRIDPKNPNSIARDKIIVSKGHAAMGLYPILADLGYFSKSELSKFGTPDGLLRIFGNISIPGIDATLGSLGHGLGIGIGYAIAAKHDNLDNRVFVVISEGEMYEGSIWESALLAAHHKLDNLVVLIDRNRKIILGDTEDLLTLEPITSKWESFGFHTLVVDGHSFPKLFDGLSCIGKTNGRPLALIANTVKGKGVEIMEGSKEWHYWQGIDNQTKALIREQLVHDEKRFS